MISSQTRGRLIFHGWSGLLSQRLWIRKLMHVSESWWRGIWDGVNENLQGRMGLCWGRIPHLWDTMSVTSLRGRMLLSTLSKKVSLVLSSNCDQPLTVFRNEATRRLASCQGSTKRRAMVAPTSSRDDPRRWILNITGLTRSSANAE